MKVRLKNEIINKTVGQKKINSKRRVSKSFQFKTLNRPVYVSGGINRT